MFTATVNKFTSLHIGGVELLHRHTLLKFSKNDES